MGEQKELKKTKKPLLLKTIGEIVKEKRLRLKKGILLLSYEYDIPNTSLAQLEKGKRDVQISTLWKHYHFYLKNCKKIFFMIEYLQLKKGVYG